MHAYIYRDRYFMYQAHTYSHMHLHLYVFKSHSKSNATYFSTHTSELWILTGLNQYPWLTQTQWVSMNHSGHVYNSHVTHMHESCHTHAWGMSHTCMRHVAHMHEACRTHAWGMSHTCMSHVTHVHGSAERDDADSEIRTSQLVTKFMKWL